MIIPGLHEHTITVYRLDERLVLASKDACLREGDKYATGRDGTHVLAQSRVNLGTRTFYATPNTFRANIAHELARYVSEQWWPDRPQVALADAFWEHVPSDVARKWIVWHAPRRWLVIVR